MFRSRCDCPFAIYRFEFFITVCHYSCFEPEFFCCWLGNIFDMESNKKGMLILVLTKFRPRQRYHFLCLENMRAG
ncbi:MAG: hypothetical protein EA399_16040 [Desulfovibrionales bacterium]|nr:MAG: hypothetical protein EA399_16040 [Desulfovibrionales bacterium]